MSWNLHPMIVHFPIALWISAFLFEVSSLIFKRESWHRTAEHVFVLAVCLTPLAVGTGLLEEQRHHLSHPVVTQHKNFGIITVCLGLIAWPVVSVLKKNGTKFYRCLFVCVLAAGVAGVVLTGFFGGKMVYEYSIGVEQ